MMKIVFTLLFVTLLGTPVLADDGAAPSFDANKLWQGAIAGLIASAVRFWSKGKGVKEFDWRFLLIYAGAGVLGGAYAAWRGLDFKDVLDWVEGSGLVMVIYMTIKGGKQNLAPLFVRGKNGSASDLGDGPGAGAGNPPL